MKNELLWTVLTIAIMLILALVVCVIQAHMESATYNRLTGANTTWWDALWVELRIMDYPQNIPARVMKGEK